ncbi:MAG: phage terminase large subunit [Elusimicrobia bacterium]|nr:phage terminase large subunit [Elusimicrobiota bacterium]
MGKALLEQLQKGGHGQVDNLLDFTLATFRGYQVNWHHKLICQKLDAWERGEIKRLMLFLPPRHGKTQLASRHLPAYIFGKSPNASIITASYSADLSSQNNRDVQRIMDLKAYQQLFPRTRLFGRHVSSEVCGSYLRNSDVFEIVGYKGIYQSAGIGGGITGRGFEYGIIDDPIKNRAEAESETYREMIFSWYTSTFYTRQDSADARILIILTRWHEDDLAGRLLKHQATGGEYADQWEIISLPAIAEAESCPHDPRQAGDALWPDKFSGETLQSIKENIGVYDWEALYQQRPQPPGGSKIKRAWFMIIDRAPEGLRWVRFWDLAVSKRTTADYTASVSGAIDKDGNFYLRDMIHNRWEWPDARKMIIQTARYEQTPIGIEEAGQQKGFIDELLRAPELRGISINGYRPDSDKLTRALPWISRAEAGNVFLIRGGWINEFLNECQLFTGCGDKYDDQIDAVSGAYKMLSGSTFGHLSDIKTGDGSEPIMAGIMDMTF